MNTYQTEFKVVMPDGSIGIFEGEKINAFTWELAEEYCRLFLPPYVYVSGELVCELNMDLKETKNYENKAQWN